MGKEKVVALDGVSLQVKEGDICCIYGVSGSGKSTLLNLMAGLEKPTEGEIILHGSHIEKMSESQLALFRQKYLGFIFQSYNLIPTMTALENVTLPLIFKGVGRREFVKRGKEILTQVGLQDRLYHRPSQMSGGQQQRVGIARAFVSKPQIVFADEPTGNLDTKTTRDVMAMIRQIAHENGQTLIIVTHNESIAHYADKIVHLEDGKVLSVEEC